MRGKRPFGWVYRTAEELNRASDGVGRHPKDGGIVHHPEEAPIVEEIITSIAIGKMTAHSMAADLNRRGIRTTEGNDWCARTISRLVHNPLHSGRVPEHQFEAVVPKRPYKTMEERKSKHLKSSHRCIERSAWVPMRKQPQPIVSPEVQDAAIAALEDQVWDWVCGIFRRPADRERLLRDMGLAQESDAQAIADAEAALVAAHRAVEGATSAIDHIIDRFEHGKLTEEDYDRLYPKRCETCDSARGRVAEAQRRRADALAAGQRWNEVQHVLADMEAQFEEADAPTPQGLQKRAAMIRRLVERVEVYPNERKRIGRHGTCIRCRD